GRRPGRVAGAGRPRGMRLPDLRRVWLAAWGRHGAARGQDAVRWWAYLAVLAHPMGGDRTQRILVTRWVPGAELLPMNGQIYGREIRRVTLPADPADWPAPPPCPVGSPGTGTQLAWKSPWNCRWK